MRTLAGLRAATSPSMPIEACAICSKIPEDCSRFDKGGETRNDDIPPETEQLVDYLGHVDGVRGSIKRCPTCRRTYWYDSEYEFLIGGSEDSWRYTRMEVDELFRSEWFIRYRMAPAKLEDVEGQPHFRHHALVRLEGTWRAIDDANATVMTIASLDDIKQLAAIDPPAGLDDPETAMRYSRVVDRVTAPRFQSSMFFSTLGWRHESQLTGEERAYIKDLQAASRVEKEKATKHDGHVVVTKWGVSEKKLICRHLTVFPSGEVQREDLVIGENLPVY